MQYNYRLVLIAWCMLITQVSLGHASVVVPVGPQNDVLLSDVTGSMGWTLLLRTDYSNFDIDIASTLASAGANDLIMLGAIRDGSLTIDVLAATTIADATALTPYNTTTTSNGSEWYFNNYSMGFAGLGDTIFQSTADTNGVSERDRLSWHTGGAGAGFDQGAGPNVVPIQIDGGWRSGNNTWLNGDSGWDKLIFVARSADNGVVPEPATLLVWSGLGLAAACSYYAKKKRLYSQA